MSGLTMLKSNFLNGSNLLILPALSTFKNGSNSLNFSSTYDPFDWHFEYQHLEKRAYLNKEAWAFLAWLGRFLPFASRLFSSGATVARGSGVAASGAAAAAGRTGAAAAGRAGAAKAAKLPADPVIKRLSSNIARGGANRAYTTASINNSNFDTFSDLIRTNFDNANVRRFVNAATRQLGGDSKLINSADDFLNLFYKQVKSPKPPLSNNVINLFKNNFDDPIMRATALRAVKFYGGDPKLINSADDFVKFFTAKLPPGSSATIRVAPSLQKALPTEFGTFFNKEYGLNAAKFLSDQTYRGQLLGNQKFVERLLADPGVDKLLKIKNLPKDQSGLAQLFTDFSNLSSNQQAFLTRHLNRFGLAPSEANKIFAGSNIDDLLMSRAAVYREFVPLTEAQKSSQLASLVSYAARSAAPEAKRNFLGTLSNISNVALSLIFLGATVVPLLAKDRQAKISNAAVSASLASTSNDPMSFNKAVSSVLEHPNSKAILADLYNNPNTRPLMSSSSALTSVLAALSSAEEAGNKAMLNDRQALFQWVTSQLN